MLNPLMLLGLLGLGVPILIHLINRQRMRPQQLATLQFLDRQDVANTFAPVPRDILQLLLRLLLLLLVVLLMARLLAPGRTVGPRAVAVVLDNSMSMRSVCPDGTTTLFEAHRARILDLVRGMRQDDFFSFTLVGDTVFASTGFTRDKAALEQAVTNAWVSDGGGRSLFAAVEDSLRELRSRRAPNVALLVFSDQQRLNYEPYLGTAPLAGLLRGSRIKPVFITDPLAEQPNVELLGAEFYPEDIYLGAGGKVTARLQNRSATQQLTTVSLKSGPVVIGSRPCNLVSGETVHVEMRQTFESPNDSAWEVSLSDDGFSADNEAYTTVRMAKRRQILFVASPAYPKPEGMTMGTSGADLFAAAVNPSEATGQAGGETYISVKRIGAQELDRQALSMYSMVVLYGLQELSSPDIVNDLAGYVRQGGGLYMIPDTNVISSTFNESFAPLLAGFRLGDLREPDVAAALDGDERSVADPLLAGLVRGEWGTVNDIRFARYFAALAEGSAKPVLKTRDGDTLVAMTDLGKGRVCLQTHSWNVTDTSLPRSLSFVYVVHAIVDRLTQSDREDTKRPDHIRVGDFHRMSLPQFRGLGGTVVLKGPRTYTFEMGVEDDDVNIQDVYVAGAYLATHPRKYAARDRWLAVNRSAAESDRSAASAEQLAGLCGGGKVVTVASDKLAGLFRPSRELYPLWMALIFVALTAETLGSVFWGRRREHDEPRA